MEPTEIQERIEDMPPDARAALRVAFEMLLRCYTEEPCKGVFLMLDESDSVLTTTGINATYQECFRMVHASHGMFMEVIDVDTGREQMQ